MPHDVSAWNLQGTRARLTAAMLEGVMDAEHPERGLTSITSRIEGGAVPLRAASILGVRPGRATPVGFERTDCYERGDDFVVSGRFAGAPDIGLQVYWRLIQDAPAHAAGIEAIISVQTQLLDSDPAVTVSSRLPMVEILALTETSPRTFEPLVREGAPPARTRGAILIRLPFERLSLVEMIHPSDDRGATLEIGDGEARSQYLVLTERLEKGVIRRSRLRTMLLPRENDAAIAGQLYERFAESPLPLTT